jgi:hypothetical protein
MYQIKKVAIEVELFVGEGSPLKGAIFVTEEISSFVHIPRLEDFLNREHRFIPFRHEDGHFSLFNKDRIFYLRSSENDHKFFEEDLLLEPINVAVHFSESTHEEGVVYPNMPVDQRRASDYFNQDSQFVPMYQDGRKLIVNSSQILYFTDK